MRHPHRVNADHLRSLVQSAGSSDRRYTWRARSSVARIAYWFHSLSDFRTPCTSRISGTCRRACSSGIGFSNCLHHLHIHCLQWRARRQLLTVLVAQVPRVVSSRSCGPHDASSLVSQRRARLAVKAAPTSAVAAVCAVAVAAQPAAVRGGFSQRQVNAGAVPLVRVWRRCQRLSFQRLNQLVVRYSTRRAIR